MHDIACKRVHCPGQEDCPLVLPRLGHRGGCPNGLAGETLPLLVRIMVLADVFYALVVPRAYEAAMFYPDSLDVVMAGHGKNCDADLVDAFIGHLDATCRITGLYR